MESAVSAVRGARSGSAECLEQLFLGPKGKFFTFITIRVVMRVKVVANRKKGIMRAHLMALEKSSNPFLTLLVHGSEHSSKVANHPDTLPFTLLTLIQGAIK